MTSTHGQDPNQPAAAAAAADANQVPSQDYQEEWYLKDITFDGRRTKIITQNLNGPCSFIAICNVLLIRGDIELAAQRESVTYEYMAQRVGDYLLDHCPGVDVGAALSMMPLTTRGMDLNPLFTGLHDFRPSGDDGALTLFEHASIKLVHGWLVDPASPEYGAVAAVGDYDSAVNLIAEADHLTQGRLVHNAEENLIDFGESPAAGSSSSSSGPSMGERTLSANDGNKVQDAIHVRTFLDNTSSQLTYHGLFELASTIKPGQLVALFRNSHLSVLYKPQSSSPTATAPVPSTSEPHFASNNPFETSESAGVASSAAAPQTSEPHFASNNPFAAQAAVEVHEHPAESSHPVSSPPSQPPQATDSNLLFLLVTDNGLIREPSVVWETLRDVDGQTSSFVDSDFQPSRPRGGDYERRPGQQQVSLEEQLAAMTVEERHDVLLARQLQQEEDVAAQQAYAQHNERLQHQTDRQRQQEQAKERTQQEKAEKKALKKKTSCLIM